MIIAIISGLIGAAVGYFFGIKGALCFGLGAFWIIGVFWKTL